MSPETDVLEGPSYKYVFASERAISSAIEYKTLDQKRVVEQVENAGPRIQEYQERLNALSTQAMLLLGAVLVPLGAETLEIIGDTGGSVCLYKSAESRLLGLLLILCCVTSMCASLFVVCASAWLNSHGQQAYLDVHPRSASTGFCPAPLAPMPTESRHAGTANRTGCTAGAEWEVRDSRTLP